MTAFTGVAHISLTVTDLERSKAWYAELLGWQEVMAGESGQVLFSVGALPGGQVVALRQHGMGRVTSSILGGPDWITCRWMLARPTSFPIGNAALLILESVTRRLSTCHTGTY